MRIAPGLGTACLLVAAGLLTGCGTDREKVLIGKWQASTITGTMMALKMKDASPSATPQEAMGAGRLLGATAMEIRKDKTFRLGAVGHVMEGGWTFDKESGELLLNTTKVQGLLGKSAFKPDKWVAYLDPDNLRLRL